MVSSAKTLNLAADGSVPVSDGSEVGNVTSSSIVTGFWKILLTLAFPNEGSVFWNSFRSTSEALVVSLPLF